MMVMNGLLVLMLVALLIPIYEACQDEDIWQKMLAFASISTKTSMMILVVSVIRDDWMIGLVGVLILSLGNASLMLLAHILKRLNAKRLNGNGRSGANLQGPVAGMTETGMTGTGGLER